MRCSQSECISGTCFQSGEGCGRLPEPFAVVLKQTIIHAVNGFEGNAVKGIALHFRRLGRNGTLRFISHDGKGLADAAGIVALTGDSDFREIVIGGYFGVIVIA